MSRQLGNRVLWVLSNLLSGCWPQEQAGTEGAVLEGAGDAALP